MYGLKSETLCIYDGSAKRKSVFESAAILHPLELNIKDSLPPSQLGQNRHNMWQHEIHCDTTSYQCQQRKKKGWWRGGGLLG